jgi:hypothetical protein
MREEFRVAQNGSQFESRKNEITKRLVYSVLRLFIWKLSRKSVLFNFNFELMLLFTEYFKIVLERFRSSRLHYRYTGGILTVVEGLSRDTVRLF